MKMWPRLKKSSEKPNESSAEQVDRVPRENAAPVDEPEEEDDAERRPHPPGVEDLAAERADPPSRHPPRDLRARCSASDTRPSAVLDLPEGDLAGDAPTTPSPSIAASPCRTWHRSAASVDSARASARPWDARGSRRWRRPSSAGPFSGEGANGSSTEPSPPLIPSGSVVPAVLLPVGVVAGWCRWLRRSCRRRRRPARAAARAPRRTPTASPAERPELVADEVQRRHENDRDRLRRDRADTEPDEHVEDDEVRSERQRRDDEEPRPLVGDAALVLLERPEPVQQCSCSPPRRGRTRPRPGGSGAPRT